MPSSTRGRAGPGPPDVARAADLGLLLIDTYVGFPSSWPTAEISPSSTRSASSFMFSS